MTSSDSAPDQLRPRGRPRDPKRSRAIVDAARTLLRDGGWDALTFEGVASLAGVGRPTVYRRWPTKGHLAAEILGIAVAENGIAESDRDNALPCTGTVRQDLIILTKGLLERLDTLESEGILPGVVAEMALDADLARQVRAEVLAPDRALVTRTVRAAIERGEVRSDVDPSLVMETITATIIYLRYLVGQPVGPAEVEPIIDILVGGLLA